MNGQLSPLFTWRGALCSDGANVTATEQHVALVLSLHMNERGGSCFPSVTTLATECKRDRRTVQRTLRTLEAGGWLRVDQGGGQGHPSQYTAVIPVDFSMNGGTPPPLKGGTTPPFDAQRAAPVRLKGGTTPPEDVIEDVRTTDSLRESAKSASPTPLSRPPSADKPKPLARQLWDVFVELYGAEAGGLERGRWNAAIKSLVSSGATPETLRVAANNYAGAMPPDTVMTPTALAANFVRLTGTPKSSTDFRADELRRAIAASADGVYRPEGADW